MTLTLHGAVIAPDGQSFTGPLASHVEAFAAQLLHQGYAQSTVRAKCALLADLRACEALDPRRVAGASA
jgi:hypothetical protein